MRQPKVVLFHRSWIVAIVGLVALRAGIIGLGVWLFEPDELIGYLQVVLHYALGLAAVAGIVALCLGGYRAQQREAERQRKHLESLRTLYEKALEKLEADAHDRDSRKRALTFGRAYYAAVMPDTYTQHFVDGMPAGTSGHQNNTAGREARIAGDIEARVGHLKLR